MYIDTKKSKFEEKRYLRSLKGDDKFAALNEIIKISNRIVFFGGAGVSTESGIPDFRSKDGLYNQNDVQFDQYDPEYLLSHSCLYEKPNVFYEFYRQKLDVRAIEPNITHYKLAEMEKKGKLLGVITQNIDGLHQKAGSRKVYEIHGTTSKNYCIDCKREFSTDYIFNSETTIPRCDKCGGIVRPDVTLYGESLPAKTWKNAKNIIYQADCLIVAGTSLTVYPAAGLVEEFEGRYVIIINMSDTKEDIRADLIFREKMGEVFSKIKI